MADLRNYLEPVLLELRSAGTALWRCTVGYPDPGSATAGGHSWGLPEAGGRPKDVAPGGVAFKIRQPLTAASHSAPAFYMLGGKQRGM